MMIVLPAGGLERPGAAFITTAGLFLTQLMFFAAGLLIASLVKKYKSAVQIGTAFLLASYVVAITARYTGLPLLDYLSPSRYFDVYEVTLNGIHIPCLITAIVLIALCVAVASRKWRLRKYKQIIRKADFYESSRTPARTFSMAVISYLQQ